MILSSTTTMSRRVPVTIPPLLSMSMRQLVVVAVIPLLLLLLPVLLPLDVVLVVSASNPGFGFLVSSSSSPRNYNSIAFITKSCNNHSCRCCRCLEGYGARTTNRAGGASQQHRQLHSNSRTSFQLRYNTNQNHHTDETTTSTSTSSTTTTVVTSSALRLSGVIADVTFQNHRPLGCIIEESLATTASSTTSSSTATARASSSTTENNSGNNSKNFNNIVFITSVTSNGYAERAGLQIGDVIVGVSSAYTMTTRTSPVVAAADGIMDVTGFSIERVKSVIMCRSDTEPFSLRVLRGTTALRDHEIALTELCSNPDTSSTETEQCMIEYIQGGYATMGGSGSKVLDTDSTLDDGECALGSDTTDDDNLECLLNDLHSSWASDLPISDSQQNSASGSTSNLGVTIADTASATNAAVKPWSSRASPSGTFVRDPATGEMKNLDSPVS